MFFFQLLLMPMMQYAFVVHMFVDGLPMGHVGHYGQQLHGKLCGEDLCRLPTTFCTWPLGCNMWGLEHAEELHMLWMHVDGLPLLS